MPDVERPTLQSQTKAISNNTAGRRRLLRGFGWRRLYELQRADSRLGFEALNPYYYVPVDLMEKVVNCRALLNAFK